MSFSLTRLSATLTTVLSPTIYSTPTLIVYRRKATGSQLISISGNGTIYHFGEKDSFTVNWIADYTNKTNAYDDNADTYAHYGVPQQGETDAVIFDYGTITERFVFYKCSAGSTYVTSYVYISNDGSSWVRKITSNVSSPTTYSFSDTFRYLKITLQATYAGYLHYIYEITAFSKTNNIYSKTITPQDKVVIEEFDYSNYTIGVEGNVNISIYERAPPSSVSEVWIK